MKLIGDRYRTYNQELSMPKVIQRIAVITAKTSAGFGDFRHALQANSQDVHFMIDPYFTSVQGELNAQGVVDQMIGIYQSGKPYDTVVLIRGGGAQADLLLFDQYTVGKAIARFPIPVVTGIGHQHNETIADLMAHTSVRTPTQAAEMIIGHNRSFINDISGFHSNIMARAERLLSDRDRQLETLNYKMAGHANRFINMQQEKLLRIANQVNSKPLVLLSKKNNGIDVLSQKTALLSRFYLQNCKANLERHVQLIRLMSPAQILKKGFAIVKVNGRITYDPADITKGEVISVILANQQFNAIVNSKIEHDNSEFDI